MLIFMFATLHTSPQFYFILRTVFYSFLLMYTLLGVIRIYLKISKKKSKLGFFLSRLHVGRDLGFHAIQENPIPVN